MDYQTGPSPEEAGHDASIEGLRIPALSDLYPRVSKRRLARILSGEIPFTLTLDTLETLGFHLRKEKPGERRTAERLVVRCFRRMTDAEKEAFLCEVIQYASPAVSRRTLRVIAKEEFEVSPSVIDAIRSATAGRWEFLGRDFLGLLSSPAVRLPAFEDADASLANLLVRLESLAAARTTHWRRTEHALQRLGVAYGGKWRDELSSSFYGATVPFEHTPAPSTFSAFVLSHPSSRELSESQRAFLRISASRNPHALGCFAEVYRDIYLAYRLHLVRWLRGCGTIDDGRVIEILDGMLHGKPLEMPSSEKEILNLFPPRFTFCPMRESLMLLPLVVREDQRPHLERVLAHLGTSLPEAPLVNAHRFPPRFSTKELSAEGKSQIELLLGEQILQRAKQDLRLFVRYIDTRPGALPWKRVVIDAFLNSSGSEENFHEEFWSAARGHGIGFARALFDSAFIERAIDILGPSILSGRLAAGTQGTTPGSFSAELEKELFRRGRLEDVIREALTFQPSPGGIAVEVEPFPLISGFSSRWSNSKDILSAYDTLCAFAGSFPILAPGYAMRSTVRVQLPDDTYRGLRRIRRRMGAVLYGLVLASASADDMPKMASSIAGEIGENMRLRRGLETGRGAVLEVDEIRLYKDFPFDYFSSMLSFLSGPALPDRLASSVASIADIFEDHGMPLPSLSVSAREHVLRIRKRYERAQMESLDKDLVSLRRDLMGVLMT